MLEPCCHIVWNCVYTIHTTSSHSNGNLRIWSTIKCSSVSIRTNKRTCSFFVHHYNFLFPSSKVCVYTYYQSWWSRLKAFMSIYDNRRQSADGHADGWLFTPSCQSCWIRLKTITVNRLMDMMMDVTGPLVVNTVSTCVSNDWQQNLFSNNCDWEWLTSSCGCSENCVNQSPKLSID